MPWAWPWALVAILLAPTALGQLPDEGQAQVHVERSNDPIPPGVPTALAVVVTVDCAAADGTGGTIEVRPRLEDPSGTLSWAFEPPQTRQALDGAECTGAPPHQAFPFRLSIMVDPSAGAYQRSEAVVVAEVNKTRTGGLNAHFNATATLTYIPDYVPRIVALAFRVMVEAAPGEEGRLSIQVANHGNGQSRITSEFIERPDGWSAVRPPPFILESKAQSGPTAVDTRTVHALYRTPTGAAIGSSHPFTLLLTSEYAGSKPKDWPRDEATVSFHVQVVPGSRIDRLVEAPDLGVPAMLFAFLLGAAAAAGARRPKA